MLRAFVIALVLATATPALGQQPPSPSKAAIDVAGGYAGFLDDSIIGHGVVSTTIRYQLTRRVSIGPELVFMAGPESDRDLFITGNMVFDFRVRPAGSRAGSVSPFVVVGGGMMRHTNRFGGQASSYVEGAWTAGGGARVWVTERVYALGEYRVGWEPHTRITGGVGVAW